MGNKIGELTVKLTLDTSDFDKALARALGKAERLKEVMKEVRDLEIPLAVPRSAIPAAEYECWRCHRLFPPLALAYVFSRPDRQEDKGEGFACSTCCSLIDTDDFVVTDKTLDPEL